ncbi:hypothetical protein [Marinoscillum pacificum]|uniref:hypothetical protein n=1 Tax=Marinoscillum pacificum TaxID=392723 RepID=UPI002157F51B|nr:hypothetical protein [Marinoscillum pacificum]
MNKLIAFLSLVAISCSSADSNAIRDLNDQIKEKSELLEQKNREVKSQEKKIKRLETKLKRLTTNNNEVFNIAELESDIRERLAIDEPVKLIAFTSGDNSNQVYVFVDAIPNSRFHQRIKSGYGFQDEDDSIQYSNLFSRNGPEYHRLKSKFIGNWKPLYRYNLEFYNYLSLCDFHIQGITISDSAIVNYYMDGLAPEVIDEVITNTDKKLELRTKKGGTHLIELLYEDQNIYIYKGPEGSYNYLIPADSIDNFPVIVQDCHELGGQLIEFDEVVERYRY